MGIITVIVNHYFDRILMLHVCMHCEQIKLEYNIICSISKYRMQPLEFVPNSSATLNY